MKTFAGKLLAALTVMALAFLALRQAPRSDRMLIDVH